MSIYDDEALVAVGGYSGNEVLHEGGQSVQSAIESVLEEVVPQGLAQPMDEGSSVDPSTPVMTTLKQLCTINCDGMKLLNPFALCQQS